MQPSLAGGCAPPSLASVLKLRLLRLSGKDSVRRATVTAQNNGVSGSPFFLLLPDLHYFYMLKLNCCFVAGLLVRKRAVFKSSKVYASVIGKM